MFDHRSPPNLSTKAGRKAYKHELRMVAVRPRRYGMWLLVLGALLLALPPLMGVHSLLGWSPSLLGMIAWAAAVPLLVLGIVRRSAYHRRRMRGGAPLRRLPS
jgi:hypothetical protein